MRGSVSPFALERPQDSARTPGGRVAITGALPFLIITHRLMAHFLGGLSLPGRRQFYPGAPCLGQANGDGLPGRPGTVFAFPDMMYFLPDKFTGLG
jgi:hypothetical protein